MDTGRGYLEEIPIDLFEKNEQKYGNKSGGFRVGEIVEIKGSLFMVKEIFASQLKLKPVENTPENQAKVF